MDSGELSSYEKKQKTDKRRLGETRLPTVSDRRTMRALDQKGRPACSPAGSFPDPTPRGSALARKCRDTAGSPGYTST